MEMGDSFLLGLYSITQIVLCITSKAAMALRQSEVIVATSSKLS